MQSLPLSRRREDESTGRTYRSIPKYGLDTRPKVMHSYPSRESRERLDLYEKSLLEN
jgi:hypothetical protein